MAFVRALVKAKQWTPVAMKLSGCEGLSIRLVAVLVGEEGREHIVILTNLHVSELFSDAGSSGVSGFHPGMTVEVVRLGTHQTVYRKLVVKFLISIGRFLKAFNLAHLAADVDFLLFNLPYLFNLRPKNMSFFVSVSKSTNDCIICLLLF